MLPLPLPLLYKKPCHSSLPEYVATHSHQTEESLVWIQVAQWACWSQAFGQCMNHASLGVEHFPDCFPHKCNFWAQAFSVSLVFQEKLTSFRQNPAVSCSILQICRVSTLGIHTFTAWLLFARVSIVSHNTFCLGKFCLEANPVSRPVKLTWIGPHRSFNPSQLQFKRPPLNKSN